MRSLALAMLVLPLGTCLVAQSPSADYDALAKEFTDARQAFFAKQKEAYEKGGDDALNEVRKSDPVKDFIARFQEGAKTHAATPEAVPFLKWVVMMSDDGPAAKEAFATLLASHADDPKLEETITWLQYGYRVIGKTETREALKKLKDSPVANLRGAALYAGAMMTLNNKQVSATAHEDALADVRKAIEVAPNAEFSPQAEGMIFEQEHLQVGAAAPDIEGTDLDGVAFKLSDYKGKVILLDFWGNW